jgi:UDP-2-acetamido-3-amino-2,3-dideoxy-glucuronate N-acetyltransferase
MNFFQHQTSICESSAIGDKTRLWAYTHVLPGARIGSECNICDFVFIENDVVLGDRVTVKSGVQLWDGIRISDDVFIGPNVTFTNDKKPRSKRHLDSYPITSVEKGASIGANSTILPGITLGQGCMIGAGSVVTKSIPAFAIAYGNPARIEGYTESLTGLDSENHSNTKGEFLNRSLPGGAHFIDLQNASDARGSLMAIELLDFKEFEIQRVFYVYDVPSNNVRGEHAHKECTQMLVPLRGTLKVILDDGLDRTEVKLDSTIKGLVIPPRIWGTQYQFSSGAVLAVFASRRYEDSDYLRNYQDFKEYVSKH